MSKPMINSPVLLGRLPGNERCKLCIPLKITRVVVPSFRADFCIWCKRVKHPVHHKEGLLRRVRFYSYCFPSYEGKTGTRSKTGFVFRESWFSSLTSPRSNHFLLSRGMLPVSCGLTSVLVLNGFPYGSTKMVAFQRLVAGLSYGHFIPSSVHGGRPAHMERGANVHSGHPCGRTRFLLSKVVPDIS
jgi:hypothetical protein